MSKNKGKNQVTIEKIMEKSRKIEKSREDE